MSKSAVISIHWTENGASISFNGDWITPKLLKAIVQEYKKRYEQKKKNNKSL